MMHDGMQYNPIQGHEPFTAGNPAVFKRYLSFAIYSGSWQLTMDS